MTCTMSRLVNTPVTQNIVSRRYTAESFARLAIVEWVRFAESRRIPRHLSVLAADWRFRTIIALSFGIDSGHRRGYKTGFDAESDNRD